jgi:hypothetical protein
VRGVHLVGVLRCESYVDVSISFQDSCLHRRCFADRGLPRREQGILLSMGHYKGIQRSAKRWDSPVKIIYNGTLDAHAAVLVPRAQYQKHLTIEDKRKY